MKYPVPFTLLFLGLGAAPALANERSFTITQFDRIRIEGAFTVEVVTGHGPSARVGRMAK
jgi:hypothetical protein